MFDEKTLRTLEYHKILEHLAQYTAFNASREKSLALRPTSDLDEARRRQAITSEARLLLDTRDFSIGGAKDVRAKVDTTRHGVILDPNDLLAIKYTIIASRNLARSFEQQRDFFPLLNEIASQLPQPVGLVDAISRAISEHGDIMDTASVKLAAIRSELRVTHDRILSRLQRMVNDPKITPLLQESLITLRDGRYVIPLRADFKGRIKAVVHDQSASGATLFVEPLPVLELNNQNRELQLEERNEERRILTNLSELVAEHADEIQHAVDIIAELDLALAAAKLAIDLKAAEPILSAPRSPKELDGKGSVHPGSVIRLWQARHPLLNPETVVPIDVELDPQTYILVITGPNTGGKTVSLKTIGLLVLMAQSGLHIPAQSGSELSIFKDIFADIGDEQSIEQSLSTFSGHITNIVRILKKANRKSLVILDELGAGTDPQEGAALARALLTHLINHSITTLVTTHHPELKAFAHAMPGVTNACVEFSLETLKPTYHLTIGLPGRSNALAIAQRLGLPDEIIDTARAEINPEDLQAEDFLDEIHRERERARTTREATEQTYQEAIKLRAELAERLTKITEERQAILGEARNEAEEEFVEFQEEIRRLRRALVLAHQPLDTLKPIEEHVAELQESLEEPVEQLDANLPDNISFAEHGPIQPGYKVYMRSLGTQGIVTTLGEDKAEVQIGMMRVRTQLADLEIISSPKAETTGDTTLNKEIESNLPKKAVKSRTVGSSLKTQSPGIELDLRGLRVDEALDALDQYLDTAYLSGLPFVRIIHGKGTGRLREAIRQALDHHPNVKSRESGFDNEGGEGVTVAKLKS